MNTNKLKRMISSHHGFFTFLCKIYNHLNPKNRLGGRGVSLSAGLTMLGGVRIENKGEDNKIILGDFVRMKGCRIVIFGNHNTVRIGDRAYLNKVELCMEDDGNEIIIGEHASIWGKSQYAAIEGTRIIIGKECLFSGDVHFRTGDSHSITDLEGKRINPSRDIVIDDHVWIGTKVTCLKGVHISRDSVVAAATTLNKDYDQTNVIIGGVPGKVIKTGVNWDIKRLPVEE
ncbi:MAG: hypothetical protein E7638_06300 [Ruminococcaceae bacterium]|nr:hypothetical protein [Oscillospiraceae bacterium]